MKNIDVTVQDGNGDTPLHEACFHGHKEIVEILLDKMKEKTQDLTNIKYIKNFAGLTPLHIACRENHYHIIEPLLNSYGSLLNECDNEKATPLHYACRNDNTKTVELLIIARSDNLSTPPSSTLKSFLTAKASNDVTPIHVAAQYGCVKVMEEFLKKCNEACIPEKDVIDARDTYNQTPLHYATEYGKTDMMKLLLDRYMYIWHLHRFWLASSQAHSQLCNVAH